MLIALDEISESLSCNNSDSSSFACKRRLSKYEDGQKSIFSSKTLHSAIEFHIMKDCTSESFVLARYCSKAPSPRRIFPPHPGAVSDPTDSSSTTTASMRSLPVLISGIWCHYKHCCVYQYETIEVDKSLYQMQ